MPSFFTHLFLPHESNNHRPKALHIDALFIYLLLFVLFRTGITTIHKAFPDVLGYATDIHVTNLLETTNQKRQAAGLAPLTLNGQLSIAAAQKANDMFAKNYWAHNSPDGKTPWDFIVSSGYRYTVAGENLAKNFSTSTNVVDAWMASPSHRENILKSSYQDVGFAVVNGVLNGEETTLVVQFFGTSPQGTKPVSVVPPKPVEITNEASFVVGSQAPVAELPSSPTTVASAFASVTKKPLINIPSVSRDVAYVFLGIIMGVLAIDAWLISRRRVVRLGGHNLAHLVFFFAITIASTVIQRGSLL